MFYPQISVVFTPQQGNVFLQQMKTIIGNHNQSNCRVVQPSPSEYIYKYSYIPKAQGALQKTRWKDVKSQGMGDFSVMWCLQITLEAIPVKCHQCDCPNLR